MFECKFKEELKTLNELKDMQKEYKENALNIETLLDILELEKLSDEEILKKYKYKKWHEIDKNIVKYLEKRYGVTKISYFYTLISNYHYKSNDCFGETYELIKNRKDNNTESEEK